MDPKIFITYSSKDQKVARTICTALENRGLICWISARNVKPGQNYQEQIVRAIRAAKVMVLVFTANANNSNEIKKELALASQNNLVVIPVRIEDVAPNEAFAYEFATRQWIDLFEDWEKSISELVELIAAILDEPPAGDRAKAAPGLPGDAAAPAFVMAAATPAAAKPAVPFIERPATRWAMIAGLAVVVASIVAFAAVKFSQRPSSTSVTTSVARRRRRNRLPRRLRPSRARRRDPYRAHRRHPFRARRRRRHPLRLQRPARSRSRCLPTSPRVDFPTAIPTITPMPLTPRQPHSTPAARPRTHRTT